MMYYSHNLHFIAMCAAMNGSYAESKLNADLLVANVGPHVKDMPPLEGFMTIPVAVGNCFPHLEEILKNAQTPAGGEEDTAFWDFSRGGGPAGARRIKGGGGGNTH